MYDYSWLYSNTEKDILSGVRIEKALKRIDRVDISEHSKLLVKISVIRAVSYNTTQAIIKTELGINDLKEISQLASLAEKINEYANTEKYNLLIEVLSKAKCTSRTTGKAIFFYFNLFNLDDISRLELNAIENADQKSIKTILYSCSSKVKVKCPNCGEEHYLNEIVIGSNVCKNCKNKGIKAPIKSKSVNCMSLEEVINSMKHENIDKKDEAEGSSDIDTHYQSDIDDIKEFYRQVCIKLEKMGNTEELGILLDKLKVINKLIDMEVN